MVDHKACPFCGHRESRLKPLWEKYWFRACLRCKAAGPVGATKEDADRLWNERRSPEPVQEGLF